MFLYFFFDILELYFYGLFCNFVIWELNCLLQLDRVLRYWGSGSYKVKINVRVKLYTVSFGVYKSLRREIDRGKD